MFHVHRGLIPSVMGAGGLHTLTLQPGAATGVDTDLSATAPTENYGTAEDMAVQTTTVGPNVIMVSMVKFDLSSIPSGANIRKATLTLCAQSTMNGTGTVGVYRVLAANSSWTNTGATWQHQAGTTNWAGGHSGCQTADTDYDSTAMGSFTVTVGEVAGTAYNISLSIAGLKLMMANNCGLTLFMAANTAPSSIPTFCTSNHATAAYRPKLVVVYG